VTEAVWIAIVVNATLFLGNLLTYIGNRRNNKASVGEIVAKTRDIEHKITKQVLENAHGELERLERLINDLQLSNDELIKAVSAKDKYIEYLQEVIEGNKVFKADVRSWVTVLVKYLEHHNMSDYPAPPAGIMDTQDLRPKK
jgi:predicted esterase YcpF (UPF0227 family)